MIRLRRAYHPFSTTLLEAYSYDVPVGFKWRDDDNLVPRLDFGCHARLTTPVARVGPIHVLYRFGDPGHALPHGYASFPDDRPGKPCR